MEFALTVNGLALRVRAPAPALVAPVREALNASFTASMRLFSSGRLNTPVRSGRCRPCCEQGMISLARPVSGAYSS